MKALSTKQNIIFVTTSIHTKWERYSQELIKLKCPGTKRLLIDGWKNWHPLKFLEEVLKVDSDYIVHIDEDCFLVNSQQLDNIIDGMAEAKDVLVAGVPDGGTPRREYNPLACNLFLIVLKTKPIRELLQKNKDWKNQKFEKSFKKPDMFKNYPFTHDKFDYSKYEPYYALFWTILKNGFKIMYLNACHNEKYGSTDIYTNDKSKPIAMHMWFLRKWQKHPHRERYELLEKEVLAPILGYEIKDSLLDRIKTVFRNPFSP